VFKKNEHTAAT